MLFRSWESELLNKSEAKAFFYNNIVTELRTFSYVSSKMSEKFSVKASKKAGRLLLLLSAIIRSGPA